MSRQCEPFTNDWHAHWVANARRGSLSYSGIDRQANPGWNVNRRNPGIRHEPFRRRFQPLQAGSSASRHHPDRLRTDRCFTTSTTDCASGALFNARTNVIAQVDVGLGSSAYQYDWDWADGSPYNAGGGDTSQGVGHFRSLAHTGIIIRNMLTTTCTGHCANGYIGAHGPATGL